MLVVQDCFTPLMVVFNVIEANVHATERFGAGSVYFVRFGSGDAGRLGMSWEMSGCGVPVCAIVKVI